MIDLDLIEQQCKGAVENGYGHLPVLECGNAVKVMEIITRLRQAEKDAARYRWLCDLRIYDQFDSIDQVFYANKVDTDEAIDEAMQCSK